jgi:hypothetical protein
MSAGPVYPSGGQVIGVVLNPDSVCALRLTVSSGCGAQLAEVLMSQIGKVGDVSSWASLPRF